MKPRAHRVERHSEHRRRFFGVETFHIPQHQHDPVLLGQLLDPRPDQSTEFLLFDAACLFRVPPFLGYFLMTVKDYNLPKGSRTAIEGYDPVAYFNAGKPAKGDLKITSVWQGVTYQFASKANRDLFNAEPEKYAPTYGGWCATAMGAKGTKVEIDPTNFKMKDGWLHLFYKDFFSDALKDWNKKEKEWEPKADANWKKTAGEDARHGTK